jgi:hypothetical protein
VASLLDVLAAELGRPDTVRAVVGTVTAVGAGDVSVSIAGGTVDGVPCARVYAAPAAGDVVLVLKIGSAWLALTALG